MVHSSLYLPDAVHEALREAAFHERCKIHDIIMQGIDAVLQKRGILDVVIVRRDHIQFVRHGVSHAGPNDLEDLVAQAVAAEGAGNTTAYFWGDEIGTRNANCNGCDVPRIVMTRGFFGSSSIAARIRDRCPAPAASTRNAPVHSTRSLALSIGGLHRKDLTFH